MRTLLRSGCLLVVVLGLQGIACGAVVDRAVELFRKWDRNNDGKLTRRELPAGARRNFSRVDRDGNGFISLSEHSAFLKRGQRRRPVKLPVGVRLVPDQDYVGDRNPRHRLDLLLPEKPVGGKPLPVVAYVHGGGWRGGDKSSGLPRVSGLVATGRYVGVSIGYRLTGEAGWPAQIHDCKAAIRWTRANARRFGIDPALALHAAQHADRWRARLRSGWRRRTTGCAGRDADSGDSSASESDSVTEIVFVKS